MSKLERACLWAAGACLVGMGLLIGAEVVARSVFHYSFEVVDELGGYLLVGVSFFSLAPSWANGSFHSVELVQKRLGAGARRASQLIFALLSLAFAGVMLFTIARYAWRSYVQDVVASTSLQTPLWLPQSAMVLGMGALGLSLIGGLWRARRQGGEHHEARDDA